MNKIGTLSNVDALKMAIQCKMDMKLYYDRAATLIKNDDATAILLGLAAKEEAHRLQLIRKYSSISGVAPKPLITLATKLFSSLMACRAALKVCNSVAALSPMASITS